MSLYSKKITALAAIIGMSFFGKAQQAMPQEGGNNLEVVFGVVLIILLGMFAYLFYIDKKVGRVEAKMNELKKS